MKLKLIIFSVVFLNFLAALNYYPQQKVKNYNDEVLISAAYLIDKNAAVTKDITMIYLEVQNNSDHSLRFEPNYNSYLKDEKGGYYYRKKIESPNLFKDGFIEKGEKRTGFLYFKTAWREPRSFELTIRTIRLYDREKNNVSLNWFFLPDVSANAGLIESVELEDLASYPVQADTFKAPNYEENLRLAKMEKPAVDQLEYKIELPQRAVRGENIKFVVYPPTVADTESVTFLIGVSNYVDLHKSADGSFVGYFRVPENFEAGLYVCSFYLRLKDGSRTIRQQNLQITDFYRK